MHISIVWWNTSLSPVTAPERATDSEKETAITMIRFFLETMQADVVALGEVSDGVIKLIRDKCILQGYLMSEGVSKIGRTRFDTCVIYREDKLKLVISKDISTSKGGHTYKVGQRLDFIQIHSNRIIHFFVCHWPSRLWCHEDDSIRHLLGDRLRNEIDRIIEESPQAHVVVMGDFNDEPFDRSLTQQLMATRDRQLAAKTTYHLYNPFWRHLASTSFYKHGEQERELSGSYFYRSDKYSRWKTFDQIMFSSSFLGKSDWHLNEATAAIIDIPTYTDCIIDNTTIFDHLPVMATVERVA